MNNSSHKKPKQRDFLYDFIAEHPGCAASDIKKNRSVSQSTVNRILKQLKAEGFITYEGSKKTGGYRIVSS
jgi:predicted transcriptional regulator